MENNELNSMIRGYIAGNVVSNNLNNEIQKQINAIEEWESHHPYSKTINESCLSLKKVDSQRANV